MSQADDIIRHKDDLFVNVLNAQRVLNTKITDLEELNNSSIKFRKSQGNKKYITDPLHKNHETLVSVRKNHQKINEKLKGFVLWSALLIPTVKVITSKISELKEQGFTLSDIHIKPIDYIGEYGTIETPQTSSLNSNYEASSGKMSENGARKLMNAESFRGEAYHLKGEKYWTIGYGHNGPDVKPGDTITKEEAYKLFRSDLIPREQAVNRLVKVPISQNMFDALVSFTYNAGVGSLAKSEILKKLNAGDYRGAAEAWKTQNILRGSKYEKGLRKRREEESRTFLLDVGENNNLNTQPIVTTPSTISKVKDSNNGISYANTSNITSHTKLTSGYNKYYNPNKGSKNMGQFMGIDITSGVGHRNVKGGSSFHKGIDLAYSYGTPVYAFCSGKVTFAGVKGGFGRVIIINDINGYRHVYGHLSQISVSEGMNVQKGQLIGKSGCSGTENGKLKEYAYAAHLHYGIWKPGGTGDKDYIDPRTYTYPGDEPTLNNNYNVTNANAEQAKSNTKKTAYKDENNKKENKIADNEINKNLFIKEKDKKQSQLQIANLVNFSDVRKTTEEQEQKDRISSIV